MTRINCVIVLLIFVSSSKESNVFDMKSAANSSQDDKSSLVFVFDTTGSMYNDLRQLIEGAEMILDTALKHSNVVSNFVFVPFNDPAVGPATVTQDKQVFISALKVVRVRGGGDCPEKSLSGILMALKVSLPGSFIYVLTDATASDYRLVQDVLDAVQRKQSQVVFVLTGHCNDLDRPQYKVYQRIAAASFGQVFNLNKTSVHNVLDFVRSSLKGRNVNLGSAVNPAGYNYTRSIPIDTSLEEMTVSVSGLKPHIRVVNPGGELITGPPKLVTTLDLSEAMVVKVLQPEAGNWTISVGSEDSYSVKVAGLSNLTFHHGFSVHKPDSIGETSLRPLQGTYNYMMIAPTVPDAKIQLRFAEMLDIEGKTLFEIPLKLVNDSTNLYLTEPFLPPEDLFFIAINGHDENDQEIRRVGSTTVQAKLPDVPYLIVTEDLEARAHEKVTLCCKIESLVPVTAVWSKDGRKVHSRVSSIQSTIVNYTIEDLTAESSGTYRCFAENLAGISKAYTEVTLFVDPPQVTLTPGNSTFSSGENLTLSCNVFSETLLWSFQLFLNGTLIEDVTIDPPSDGYYTLNKTVTVDSNSAGLYSCRAENKGGKSDHTSLIKVLTHPSAHILGPHNISNTNNNIQLTCQTVNAKSSHWISPNGTVIKVDDGVSLNISVLQISNLTVSDDGIWTCVAVRDGYEGLFIGGSEDVAAKRHTAPSINSSLNYYIAVSILHRGIKVSLTANYTYESWELNSDSINVNVSLKPTVSIEAPRNITLFFGTEYYNLTCKVSAKPKPDVFTWFRGNQSLLQSSITTSQDFFYSSVLTLTNVTERTEGNYSCFVESSAGFAQDDITVNVRKNMSIVQRFQDETVDLYSSVDLKCIIDSYPLPVIKWYHNGTSLQPRDNIRMSMDKSSVSIDKVDFDDLGMYVCTAENAYERIVLNGTLYVKNLERPLLSKEPIRRVTTKGKSTIVTCRILQGKPTPHISWQYKRNRSDAFTAIPDDIITTEDGHGLLITTVNIQHGGRYLCVAKNVVGNDTYEIDLVVQYPPQKDPNDYGEQNGPIELKAGERLTLSCNAIGSPQPIVIWTKDNRPVVYTSNVYLTDDSVLTIEKATEYDSGLFTCIATSPLGSMQRNFSLVVYVPPTVVDPQMDKELDVLEGQLVELPCFARGVPKPQLEWRQNGELITERRKHIDEDFVLRFVANLTDFGEYTCVAINKYGNASLSFNIHIWVPPYIEPPSRTSVRVPSGSNNTLQCNAVGFPIPTVVWEFKNKRLIENTTYFRFNNFGDIYINNASFNQHDGDYTCIAENDVGVDKKTITLNVYEAPKILKEDFEGPYIATIQDSALTLSCRATGKPKPFVIWSRDGHFIDIDSRYDVDQFGSLTMKTLSEDMSGLYICLGKNFAGEANKTVEVQIYTVPDMMQSDETQHIITVLEGSNSSIECPLRPSNNFTVKWYKDAKLISQGNLTLSNVSRNNASGYACTVTNAVGSAFVAVSVDVEWRPRFVNKVDNAVEVVTGEDIALDCAVDAKPLAKTSWMFNSQLLFEDKERLRLLNVRLSHSGVYKCLAKNAHGHAERQFTLDVLEPPFISVFDVLDVQLKDGDNATLDCIAKGSPTPNITWTFSNSNWKQLNNSLVCHNASISSQGVFRCDAASRAGRTHLMYRVRVLAVAAVSNIVLFDGNRGADVHENIHLLLGETVRIACNATGNPAPHIQWVRNGKTVAVNSKDILYADLMLTGVVSTHSGVYTCLVSNEVGFGERAIKVEVLEPPKISTSLFDEANKSKTKYQELMSGQTFYLHCHPFGNPVPQLYWFKDGGPLRLFDDKMVLTDYGEIIVSNSALLEHSGNYTCVARNKVGEATFSYLVDVLEPPPKPKESRVQMRTTHGKDIVLNCPVYDTPVPKVSWVKHPYTEISDKLSPRFRLSDDNSTLTIDKTESTDAGKYSCVMSNKVGITEVEYSVHIERAPSIKGSTELNNSVTMLRAKIGRSVALDCIADGEPRPTVTWFKNAQPLSKNIRNIQKALDDNVLTIWRLSVSDAAQYVCVAGNTVGLAHRRFKLQLTGKWSSWSQWSFCNATCGLGYQRRSRSCQYVDDDVTVDAAANKMADFIVVDESACAGGKQDRRKCHMPACEDGDSPARWSPWTNWSQCSASCGAGTQTRSRKCKSNTIKCYGDNMQIRKCPHLPECNADEDVFNDVLYSREEVIQPNPYIPEMTYESEPYFGSNPEVEEFYERSETIPLSVFEVDVSKFNSSKNGPCDFGFTYDNTTAQCEDIDECLIENNACHSTQSCRNSRGGYSCACAAGYAALGAGQRCLDINECAQETAECAHACVNVVGGYVCACPAGSRLRADRRSCAGASGHYSSSSVFSKHVEEVDDDYLALSMEVPERYTKRTRN